jgi:hypothetical protein
MHLQPTHVKEFQLIYDTGRINSSYKLGYLSYTQNVNDIGARAPSPSYAATHLHFMLVLEIGETSVNCSLSGLFLAKQKVWLPFTKI